MFQYKFDQEKIAEEVSELQRKASQCLEHYPNYKDIETAPTERVEEYSEGKFKLYHYKPKTELAKGGAPILIVYALVNRPYILDIDENRSFISSLLEKGHDIYLIDWGYPSRKDRFISFDDYVDGYIHRAVKHITRKLHINKVNLMGVCQGGTMSICFSALHPELVDNLICLITPVDFDKDSSRLSKLVENIDIDALVDSYGNIPGDMLNWHFIGVNPADFISRKYLGYLKKIDDNEESDFFLRMEKWAFDCPDQTGESFRKFCKDLYQQNNLIKKNLLINGRPVKTENINMPILNVFAKNDLIVQKESAKALKEITKSEDYSEIEMETGHIGFLVKTKDKQTLTKKISAWLESRSTATKTIV